MERAEQILTATESLLVEGGLRAVSAGEIAKRAGANKALVFYHWGSVDDVVRAALERYYARHKAALSKSLEDVSDLANFVDSYFDFLKDHHSFARVIQEQVSSHGPYRELVAEHMQALLAWTEERLGALLPGEGPLSPKHFQLTFSAAAINYFTYAPLFGDAWGHDPLSHEGLEERRAHLHWIVDAWLRAL